MKGGTAQRHPHPFKIFFELRDFGRQAPTQPLSGPQAGQYGRIRDEAKAASEAKTTSHSPSGRASGGAVAAVDQHRLWPQFLPCHGDGIFHRGGEVRFQPHATLGGTLLNTQRGLFRRFSGPAVERLTKCFPAIARAGREGFRCAPGKRDWGRMAPRSVSGNTAPRKM